MASPRTAPGQKTQLSLFLRDYRLQTSMSQDDLQKKLGYAKLQYVSKLETGKIGRPAQEFLEALANETGKTTDELLRLSAEPATEAEAGSMVAGTGAPSPLGPARSASRILRIASGHCAWAAPLFIAARRAMLPRVRVATWRTTRSDGAELVWIPGDHCASEAFQVGSNRHFTLSAVDVLDLLKRGQIDVGAVPGGVIDSESPFLLRVGTMVDSATGCTLVVPKNRLPRDSADRDNHSWSTHDLGAWLLKDGNKNRCIGVEFKTIADRFLSHAIAHAHAKDGTINRGAVRWHLENQDISHATWGSLAGKKKPGSDLAGVITWEPHATWLQEQSKDDIDLKKVQLHFAPDAAGRPTHMSFDLVIRNGPVDEAVRKELQSLMETLAINAGELLSQRDEDYDPELIWEAARHLGFTQAKDATEMDSVDTRKTIKALGSIRYCVYWDVLNQRHFWSTI